ncbi:MAG: RrF2 family transcriptional regulator [Bdellovibrionota bacterium]
MIKLNRTTEYALMALRHMSRKRLSDPGEVTSAREVADRYGLPFEITAKTLLRLKDAGLIQSAQGARGGYTLARDLAQVNLADFLARVEGPQALVACVSPSSSASAKANSRCEYDSRCEIKHLVGALNTRVLAFLGGIHISELIEGPGNAPGLGQAIYQIDPVFNWAASGGEEP